MRIFTTVILILGLGHLCYGEILSVTTHTAYLKSAPYSSANYEVPVNYPLFVLQETEEFLEVTDFENRRGWVNRGVVGNAAAVVIKADQANVRKGPGLEHDLVFRALRGVAFQVVEINGEWVHVKHESGKQGWVHEKLTWGI
jgi:SH3-like domain-containing protein